MVLNMRSEGRGLDEVEAGFEVEVKCVQHVLKLQESQSRIETPA
jgi:hypothetical protein